MQKFFLLLVFKYENYFQKKKRLSTILTVSDNVSAIKFIQVFGCKKERKGSKKVEIKKKDSE